MLISVTNQDLEQGNISIGACPITIALRRHFGGSVSISRNYIRILKKKIKKGSRDRWVLITLPKICQNFILNHYRNNFDNYVVNKPFQFELSRKDIKALKG